MPFGFTLYTSFILSEDEQSFARRNSRLCVNGTDNTTLPVHDGKSDVRMSLELRLYLCLKQIHCDGKKDMFITTGTCPFVSLRRFPYTAHATLGNFDSVWVDRFQPEEEVNDQQYEIKTCYTARNKEEQERKDFIVDRELQRQSFVALSWIESCIQNNQVHTAILLINRAANTLRLVATRIQNAVARLADNSNLVIPTYAVDIVTPNVRNWEECVREVRRVFHELITNKCDGSDDESDIMLSVTGMWRMPLYCGEASTVKLSDVIRHLVDGETVTALHRSALAADAAPACLESATLWGEEINAP